MMTVKNTSHYWKNSSENTLKAKLWIEKMANTFPNEIQFSTDYSVIYYEGFKNPKDKEAGWVPQINVNLRDSVSAVVSYKDFTRKVCVLNFASFKEPGGKFMSGSSAQEESLCIASTLFNVLDKNSETYYRRLISKDWNNLYKNEGIYTPGIIFLKDIKRMDFTRCDVLSVAAPNKHAAMRYENITEEENTVALRSRIKYVLDILKEEGVNIPILGAFGCGVFAQDPKQVAEIFREFLLSGDYKFDMVDFSIIDEKTYDIFRSVFEKELDLENNIEEEL